MPRTSFTRIKLPVLSAIALLLTSTTFAAENDQTYTIKVARGATPGLLYDTHAIVEQIADTTIATANRPPQTTRTAFKADLTGRVHVFEADAIGRATSVSISIKHLLRSTGQDMIKPGTVVDIKISTTTVTFEAHDNAFLSTEAKSALALLYPKLGNSTTTDDDVLGTVTPRKLGETWPINADAAAKDLNGRDLKTTAKAIHGTVTFKALESAEGAPAYRLNSTFSVDNVEPPENVPGFIINGADLKSQTSQLLPADPALPPLETESNILISERLLSQKNSSGAEIILHMHTKETITQVKDQTATALPK